MLNMHTMNMKTRLRDAQTTRGLTDMIAAKQALAIITLFIVIAVSAGCAGSSQQQSTGDYVDDAVVTTKVKAALVEDDQVDAIDIQVTTFKGVVQLSGFADTNEEQQRAVTLAGRVNGVKRVENDIRIKPAE